MMRNTKFFTGALILLIVLNLVTIGSLVYHQRWEKKQTTPPASATAYSGVTMLNGRFFRQELGFDQEQMKRFREINQQFRPQTMQLLAEIDSLKEDMFNAMCANPADTQRIVHLATAIGERHGQLKTATYHLFAGLKSICTDQQVQQLQNVFRPLFLNEDLRMNPGDGQRKGPARKTD